MVHDPADLSVMMEILYLHCPKGWPLALCGHWALLLTKEECETQGGYTTYQGPHWQLVTEPECILWLFLGCHAAHVYLFFIYFLFFRATPVAHGGSQVRGHIRAVAPSPYHSHIWATSVTYTTAHGNKRSLTHWARPGIEPASSWTLVRFVSTAPWRELLPHV